MRRIGRTSPWPWLGAGIALTLLTSCGVASARHADSSATAPKIAPSPASASRSTPGGWEFTAMTFISPDIGWLAADRLGRTAPSSNQAGPRLAVFGTTDGGRKWTLLDAWAQTVPSPWMPGSDIPNAVPMNSLSFRNRLEGWGTIPLGASGCQQTFAVVHTTDGGRHWHLLGSMSANDGPVSLAFNTPGTGWLSNGSCASDQTFLMSTADGGLRWTLPGSRTFSGSFLNGSAMGTDVHFSSPEQGFMVNAYMTSFAQPADQVPQIQTLVTTDGGQTWRAVPFASGTLRGMVLSLSFASPSIGWVVLRQGAHATLEATTDAGRHWTLVKKIPLGSAVPGSPIMDRVSPTVGYVLTTPGILWKTTNGGSAWQRVPLP